MNLKAIDEIVLTLSKGIKQKLIEAEFNNGYLMLLRLRFLFCPLGNTEFIRLSKEYFTLLYNTFLNISTYLTYIKVLEEKIDATKVDFEKNRTILYLIISLPPEYQYLVQI